LHYVNDGFASWFELARAVFTECGADPSRVRPVLSHRMRRPAPRPRWSVLSTDAWNGHGLTPPRHWRTALAEVFAARR
jgi:dTDP-4-dehydrorhamnose reductase